MQITVTPGHRGRHLFEETLDTRIRLLGALTDGIPDLIVFPCGQDRRLDKARSIIVPDDVLRRIADGRIGLVFDASTEGVVHKSDLSDALHATIEHFGAKPRNCVYVTQERNYRLDYTAHCARVGWGQPIEVLVHDYWIWDAVRHFARNGDDVYRQRFNAFRSRQARRTKRFVSLNRTPRPIKVLFLLRLLGDGLWDSGFISFGGFRTEREVPGKTRPSHEEMTRALPGFEDLVDDLMPHMETLANTERRLLGMEQHGWSRLELWNAGMAADLAEYADSWFTVVTETEMRARPSRITEKTLKPLVNFHPLIMLGNPGSLRMVREYGFVTFENVIDESYDEELDPRRRFDLAYAEFTRLCQMGDTAWSRLEHAISDLLVFNAQWGLTQLPTDMRRQQDKRIIDAILAAVNVVGNLPRRQADHPGV
jgi:hypothetical protein